MRSTRPVLRHVALPALAPAALVGLFFTPVMLFGCVNRGLLALAIALGSAVGAFVTLGIAFRLRARRAHTSYAVDRAASPPGPRWW